MEFRLTYHGPLLAETQRDGVVRRSRAEHKQEIRKTFHAQLRRWWEVSPFLHAATNPASTVPGPRIFGRRYDDHSVEELSRKFERFGYNFVPLVTRELELLCAIEVLFLRHGSPGDLFTRVGDLDNRLKTLFDALTVPRDASQVGPFTAPALGETPFFCLLEDDSVITKASVESDILLETKLDPPDPNESHVVITVRIRPARVTATNVSFAS